MFRGFLLRKTVFRVLRVTSLGPVIFRSSGTDESFLKTCAKTYLKKTFCKLEGPPLGFFGFLSFFEKIFDTSKIGFSNLMSGVFDSYEYPFVYFSHCKFDKNFPNSVPPAFSYSNSLLFLNL